MCFSQFLLATPTYGVDASGLIHYLQTVPNPKQTKSNLKLASYKTTCVSTITLNYSFNISFLMLKLLCYMPQSLRKSSLRCFRPQLKPPATTMATVMKSITGKEARYALMQINTFFLITICVLSSVDFFIFSSFRLFIFLSFIFFDCPSFRLLSHFL